MSISLSPVALPARARSAIYISTQTAIVEWCSPKSFRVETGLAWLAEGALSAGTRDFWWVGPSYMAAMSALGLFKAAMPEGTYNLVPRANAAVLISGATIWFKAAETPATLYSDTVAAAIIDGGIQIAEKSWLVLRETLANSRALARIVSTVAGKDNWFNLLARRVEAEPTNEIAYSKFSALDAIAEGILSQADLDYARSTLPDHVYRSMYLCEPYDDRVEAAHKASDPRLMSDTELAIIAGLDPNTLAETSDETLQHLARS